MVLLISPLRAQWLEKESAHFRVVYRSGHSHLVPNIISSAESSLARISGLFSYTPHEKIVINTYDVNDYGAASTTTVPHNYIWLDIAPLEPSYENIPYSERISWLISHELAHVVVNDLATDAEAICRGMFSKVPPEQPQPLSVFYSLLTNFSRYTPRWHQEGIAVFLETWLSGGYGRAMGSFDEMYFRSLIEEGKEFPSWRALEAKVAPTSFLLETHYYLFGGRFASHLAKKYGTAKLIEWYRTSGSFYSRFTSRFKETFGICLNDGWREFAGSETAFQRDNLERLRLAPLTPVRRIGGPAGGVTQPYYDSIRKKVLFGSHAPHQLARIVEIDPATGHLHTLGSLQTPSLFQVASTAYDEESRGFFFTTNNNQFYRDVWQLDVGKSKQTMIAENARIGHLTYARGKKELWGIRHSGGVATLVAINLDSVRTIDLIAFDTGTEVFGLSLSPASELLAAVLHHSNGEQKLVVVNAEDIRSGGDVKYVVISDEGSPENPSWSHDGGVLYWNAYTNGVSNVYKKNVIDGNIVAVTHTTKGLFHPVFLSEDSLFAFEFSTDGFVPVVIPNGTAERLPAISYLGQNVMENEKDLAGLRIGTQPVDSADHAEPVSYSGLARINLSSLFPIITGFQSQKALGLQARLSDPLLTHDITLEAAVSPFREKGLPVRYHWKIKYEYLKEYDLSWDHNSTDFFDLFNSRKRGMAGDKFRLGHNYYWVYDNPLKAKQQSEIALFANVTSISDNLVQVSQPDFILAQTAYNLQHLRRSIGSVDFEDGNELNIAMMYFGAGPKTWESSVNLYAEWDHYATFIIPHNVLHFKLSAGLHMVNDRLVQSRFYFGGFGNRALENVGAKQYRTTFSMPGIPAFSLGSDRFVKVLVENSLPPWRIGWLGLGQHYVSHIELAVFGQAMYTASGVVRNVFSAGAQVNIVLKHWFNLESTLSGGAAKAWTQGRPTNEWFISFKLLRN